jgi:HD-GYP domain-containing protein (c-di-GMP phosphodiesterase class II)
VALAQKYRWSDADGRERPLLSEEEVENLTIARGTLNAAERKIIQYHASATIKLLEELPFPEHMRNVPAIAGSHHERIDGHGYPNRLRGHQISMQGRILGLADVFEALSAKDRPYKRGKTLGECLAILEQMSAEGHIDPDLYELFVRERLYLRYAIEHIDPEQIDEAYRDEFEQATSGIPS